MDIVATRTDRSMKFEQALRLKGCTLDLSAESEDLQIIDAAYKAARVLMEPMRLRQLKPKDYDQRFLDLLESVILPYHRLVSQHGLEYFERLRKAPDSSRFEELGLLRRRKRALIEAWKKEYSKHAASQHQD